MPGLGARDPNSDPHACVVSMSLTEPRPPPALTECWLQLWDLNIAHFMILLAPVSNSNDILKDLFIFISYAWVLCLNVYLGSLCMPGACRGQQETPDALELELGVVVSGHVEAGSQEQTLLTIEPSFQHPKTLFLPTSHWTHMSEC